MFARFWTGGLLAAALLGGLVAPAHAGEARLVTKVYAVADLVVPLDGQVNVIAAHPPRPVDLSRDSCPKAACEHRPAPPAARQTLEDQLIRLITTTFAPQSWVSMGGHGTIEYYPLGMALIINQTPVVHEQIAALLNSLRRPQDVQVAAEVRVLTVADGVFERLGVEMGKDCWINAGSRVAFLSDRQVSQLLEAAQGDCRTNVLQAPKVTMFNGQRVQIAQTSEQFFVTGMNVVPGSKHIVYCPRQEKITTGLRLALQPTVSADRRYVHLEVELELTSLEGGPVSMTPVMATIVRVEEGGQQEPPMPPTQDVQQPVINSQTIRSTAQVPDGGTVLLGGIKTTRQVAHEVPVLSGIQWIDRLFRQPGTVPEAQQVYVLVTPRIVISSEEEVRPCPAPPRQAPAAGNEEQEPPAPAAANADGRVASLVKRYQEACAAGQLERARNLAKEALDLDPACFNRPARRQR